MGFQSRYPVGDTSAPGPVEVAGLRVPLRVVRGGLDSRALRREAGRQEQLVAGLRGNDDDEAARELAKALARLAGTEFDLEQFEDAASHFHEAATLLWRLPNSRAAAVGARARQTQALVLAGRRRDALQAAQDLLDLNVKIPSEPDLIPGILGTKMLLVKELGTPEQTMITAASLIGQVDPPQTPAQRMLVASAMVLWGQMEQSLGGHTEAIEAFEIAIERFGSEDGEDFRQIEAEAHLGRGISYEATDDSAKALADYEQTLRVAEKGHDAVTDEVRDEAATRLRALTARAAH